VGVGGVAFLSETRERKNRLSVLEMGNTDGEMRKDKK
jgi:hypothetical protein